MGNKENKGITTEEIRKLKLEIAQNNYMFFTKYFLIFVLVIGAMIASHDIPGLMSSTGESYQNYMGYFLAHLFMILWHSAGTLVYRLFLKNSHLFQKIWVSHVFIVTYVTFMLGSMAYVDALNFKIYSRVTIYIIVVFLTLLVVVIPTWIAAAIYTLSHISFMGLLIFLSGDYKSVADIGINTSVMLVFAVIAARLRYTGILERNIQQQVLNNQNEIINRQYGDLKKEQENSNRLLLSILPSTVANELKEHGFVDPELYENVTIMFTDFVGFTRSTLRIAPTELVKRLDTIFLRFDLIAEANDVERLKTIGDSYMAAGGLPLRNDSHPVDVVLCAMEMTRFMREYNEKLLKDKNDESSVWAMRIGIHTGPVVAGVIGKTKFAYDIWGDTVNIASRMETTCATGRINVTKETYKRTKDFFSYEYRGEVLTKNRGNVEMYYLNGIHKDLAEGDNVFLPGRRFFEQYRIKFGKPMNDRIVELV